MVHAGELARLAFGKSIPGPGGFIQSLPVRQRPARRLAGAWTARALPWHKRGAAPTRWPRRKSELRAGPRCRLAARRALMASICTTQPARNRCNTRRDDDSTSSCPRSQLALRGKAHRHHVVEVYRRSRNRVADRRAPCSGSSGRLPCVALPRAASPDGCRAESLPAAVP